MTLRRSPESFDDSFTKCWAAVLWTLGLDAPFDWETVTGTQFDEYLEDCPDYDMEPIYLSLHQFKSGAARYPTLAEFIADHPTGTYVLYTAGHVMALVDGTLTDTDRGATGRRRVTAARRLIPVDTDELAAA